MATNIENLQSRASEIQTNLSESPTYISRNPVSTASDVRRRLQLAAINKQINTAKSKQLQTTWYGKDKTAEGDTPAQPDGLIMKGIKTIQKPLNAIVGAGQYALGKGVKPTLAENVNEAMKTGLVSGDVMRQLNLPKPVATVGGFLTDVALDPLNWATAGTALVPRISAGVMRGAAQGAAKEGALGLVKGATEGGLTGLTSNLAGKASYLADLMPFAKKMARATEEAKTQLAEFAVENTAKGIPKTAPELIAATEEVANSRMGNLASKYQSKADWLADIATKESKKYDLVTGTSVMDKLKKGGGIGPQFTTKAGTQIGLPSSVQVGDFVEAMFKKIPSINLGKFSTPSGEQIYRGLEYSTERAAQKAALNDRVLKEYALKSIIPLPAQAKTAAHFEVMSEFLNPNARAPVIEEGKIVLNKAGQPVVSAQKIWKKNDPIRNLFELNDDFKDKLLVRTNTENAAELLQIKREDNAYQYLIENYKEIPINRTGVQWWDKLLDRFETTTFNDLAHARLGSGNIEEVNQIKRDALKVVENWNLLPKTKVKIAQMRPLEGLLIAQRAFTSVFKAAKVPMNLGSHVVANLGNVVMGKMMGLPMESIGYLDEFIKANQVLSGKSGLNGLEEMFSDFKAMADMMKNNPTQFRHTFGFSVKEVLNQISKGKGFEEVAEADFTKKAADIIRMFTDEIEQASKLGTLTKEKTSSLAKLTKKKLKLSTGSETLSKTAATEGGLTNIDVGGSFTENEIQKANIVRQLEEKFAQLTADNPRNISYQLADTLFNRMPKAYEHIDQTFKIATTNFLSKVGLTEEQLLKMNRSVRIYEEDLLETVNEAGRVLYRIKPQKASQIAMETFMNYSAMPDFVRIMRNLPLVGSPFFSFPYAMALKTSKTAIDNPSLFNKVSFMMAEFSGTRTPEEKEAMKKKYNQYLNSPTVVKIGGMWNTDVKNWIPYYTLNMFNPSERTYSDSISGQIMKYSDKFPVLQTPLGQTIKDYFIQPWLLSGTAEVAQGQFGQPIYPSYDINGNKIDPSLATKGFYAGRNLAEAFIPGTFGYLGAANYAAKLSPEAVNRIPLYGARVISNATQGRSSIGTETKENAMQKTLRAIAGRTGIPLYTLDTTQINLPK